MDNEIMCPYCGSEDVEEDFGIYICEDCDSVFDDCEAA